MTRTEYATILWIAGVVGMVAGTWYKVCLLHTAVAASRQVAGCSMLHFPAVIPALSHKSAVSTSVAR